jgi:hypothetical protein
MWHLLGPIVRWPLHSPRRLLTVVVAAIALVMALGAINDRGAASGTSGTSGTADAAATAGAQPGDDPTATPSGEPTDGTDATGGTDGTDGTDGTVSGGTDAFSEDPAADDPVVAAQQVAAEFVAAWARPDLDAATWQAGLAPHATPELLATLADTDPANVPAVTVSGEPVRVAANAEAGVFDVPTTGEFVRVFVQLVDGVWLATDVQPTA